MLNRGLIVWIVVCGMGFLPSYAQPQEANSDQRAAGHPGENKSREEAALPALDEVIVTARRRDESLQDVPISIASVTGESLERARVDSVTELSRVVPGFTITGGGQSTISLRGLSTFSSETHAPQSVGVLVDDVVLGTIAQSVTEFSDISRVEVLRGPQGTLFGRNTTGGVMHIITNDPVDEFEGKASMSYGSYDEVKWSGMLNVPLTDNLATRTSIFTSNREGHIENINDGRMLGGAEKVGARMKILYSPREDFELKFNTTYAERDELGYATTFPVIGYGPTATQLDRDVNVGIAGPKNDKVNGVGVQSFKDRIGAASLIWEQSIGDLRMTSITAFESWHWDFGDEEPFRTFNLPVEPLPIHKLFVSHELKSWSQELRLSSPTDRAVEYVVGAFISKAERDERRDFLINAGTTAPGTAGALFLFNLADQNTEHLDYAIFGEADFSLTDVVTLTAGVRWTRDETDLMVEAVPVPFLIPGVGLGISPVGELWIPFLDSELPGTRAASVSASEWTWRTGLRWTPIQELMVYGSVARGFKGPTITALSHFVPVEPEIVTSYEMGMKATFLDNRISGNLQLFSADIEDFQAQGQVEIEGPQGPIVSIFLTNAAKARTQGMEFELSAALTDRLIFDIGLAYIDAEFESYPDATCYAGQTIEQGCSGSFNTQDLSGKRLPRTPEWSGNASAAYNIELPFWNFKNWLRLDYSYRDEVNWDNGLAPLNVSEAVGIWGLSFGLSSPDERYEMVGFVKNLTDEYYVYDLRGGNGTTRAWLQPEYQRTWGVTFNYAF